MRACEVGRVRFFVACLHGLGNKNEKVGDISDADVFLTRRVEKYEVWNSIRRATSS